MVSPFIFCLYHYTHTKLTPWCSSNTPDTLLPQGLCTHCSFCLEHSCPIPAWLTCSPPSSLGSNVTPFKLHHVLLPCQDSPFPSFCSFSRAFLTTHLVCSLLIKLIACCPQPSPHWNVSAQGQALRELGKEGKPSSASCSLESLLCLLKDAESSSFKTALPASLLLGEGPTFFFQLLLIPQLRLLKTKLHLSASPLAMQSPDLSQVKTSGGRQRENRALWGGKKQDRDARMVPLCSCFETGHLTLH